MLTADDIEETWPGQFPRMAGNARIAEKMENFIKVTRCLTKLKETLINYV